MKEREFTCPLDGRLLDYFKDNFEHIFVSLHPFIRAVSIDPELFCPETYPKKPEIIANCEPVLWEDVSALAGFENINEIDVGLRTQIGGIKQQFQRKDLADKFDAIDPLFCPTEGCFSPFVENRLLTVLASLGYFELTVRDEHLETISPVAISDLLKDDRIPYAGSILTEDKQIYATTHWDSHYSIVCTTNIDILEGLVKAAGLEGFYCDETTEVYWGVKNLAFSR